ncbi:hypothetical protein ACFLVZ_01475 [Chloroflexota bacterium]
MLTNKILDILITITSFVTVPVQLVTTLILGILVRLTFGLLLFPFSFVWIVLFLLPLIGISFVWEKIKFARWLVAIIGVPIALIGDTYVSLIPSMGEMESRIVKMLYCQTYPYTWKFHQLHNGKLKIHSNDELYVVLRRVSKDKAISEYLNILITK